MQDGKRKRVPIEHLPMGNPRSEGRAFIPDGWDGEVMLYRFDVIEYRDIKPNILQAQLDGSLRAGASMLERVRHRYGMTDDAG